MLKAEKNYQFRERMRALHGDQRDAAVKAAADELAIETGWQVVLPPSRLESRKIAMIAAIWMQVLTLPDHAAAMT